MGARWMKKNKNGIKNKKYFNDPVQNAAFICCIDILAELVEKYGDKVLEAISNSANSGSECDYIFISNEISVLCEVEKVTNEDITKAYVHLVYRDGLIEKTHSA